MKHLLYLINKKWFINLSNTHIKGSSIISIVVIASEDFGLPINKYNIDETMIEFKKSVENNISGRPINIVNFIRNN